MVKKVLIGVCVLLLALALTCGAETYSLTTIIVSLDYITDEVVAMDFNGNEWVFYGCEDWCLMDVCSLTMDDNDTLLIYDDVIVNYRYSGWCLVRE